MLETDAPRGRGGQVAWTPTCGCPAATATSRSSIAHKPSDLLTVGDAGSQAVAIAKDLLHLCDTKVLLGQDEAVADELAGLLGLHPMAERIVTTWAMAAKGRALWLVGDRPFQVETILTPEEQILTFTNDALIQPKHDLRYPDAYSERKA